MPVLKIWDKNREVKKCIVVEELTMETVKEKVESKFNYPVERLVLEEDGTEIDDDEVLEELKKQTLMVLGRNQIWIPEKVIVQMQEECRNSSHEKDVEQLEVQGEELQNILIPDPVRNKLQPTGMPPASKLPLPELSPALKLSLQSGSKNSTTFNQVLKECSIFYMTKYPNMAESTYYQDIGKRMVKEYPCLAYSEGTKPWTFFIAKLSQRMRTERWKNNGKSKRKVSDGSLEESAPTKRFRVSNRGTVLSEDDFESHVTELKKEWETRQSHTHIRVILQETRSGRLAWQRELKPGKIEPILQRFPCFEEGNFILHEFLRMRGDPDPDKLLEDINNKMAWVFQHVASKVRDLEGSDFENELELFCQLENLTGKKKGKGSKTKSCIKHVKDVGTIEDVREKDLKTDEEEAPKLIVFSTDKDLLCTYIVGDACKIFFQSQSLLEAVVVLLATYYVFDLSYPGIYSQVLGFLQHWIIGDQFTENKCSNWIKLSDELSRKTNT